jgi:hypothetical protein
MQFIEWLMSVSPDGGNGSFEVVLMILASFAGVHTFWRWMTWARATR